MNANHEQLDFLALCALKGVDWHLLAREAQRPDGLGRLLAGEIVERSKQAAALKRLLKDRTALAAARGRVESEVEKAARAGAVLVTVLDDDYPINLRLIFNLPPFLFVRGALKPVDAFSVAVVGTRGASEEGIKRAQRMARLLTERGVTVVSGLARGIDTAAHTAVLESSGRTVAVIGTGILRTYPKENAELAERIAATGAIVSQFWPDAPPTQSSFPMRNVTMSGITQGTVVIEASSTSGAKMQARLALEHGKRAFLLQSLVTSQPWAQKYLERPGAVEVHDVEDVLGKLRQPSQIQDLSSARMQLTLSMPS